MHGISYVITNQVMLSFFAKYTPGVLLGTKNVGKLCRISRRYHYKREKFRYVVNCLISLDKIRQAYNSIRYMTLYAKTLQISVSLLDVSNPK